VVFSEQTAEHLAIS